ncbi:hypothetical protein [Acaryochloris sp. 'Moss Beach']|uniref:hypothetical protein n=1 Tax=Acaryochloris sp. 'Moss Beach' TaxID=2740837 RepID=UPI001F1604A7|nr:hypothetical protein [Acaryochloris sp. 'Moss Beach']
MTSITMERWWRIQQAQDSWVHYWWVHWGAAEFAGSGAVDSELVAGATSLVGGVDGNGWGGAGWVWIMVGWVGAVSVVLSAAGGLGKVILISGGC